jgi:hypothetical protein
MRIRIALLAAFAMLALPATAFASLAGEQRQDQALMLSCRRERRRAAICPRMTSITSGST